MSESFSLKLINEKITILFFCLALSPLLLFTPSQAQSRWFRIYHEDWDAPMLDIHESYDGGYLLTGRQIPNYPKYNWLIKTDINGEILWEKMIGDGAHYLVLINFAQSPAGEIFLVGTTQAYGDYSDPIIMKLDACGEKQWCKAIPSYDNLDYAYDVVSTQDGGCAVTLRYTGTEPGVDRICLMKLSSDGEVDWKQCYNSADTNLQNQEHYDLIRAIDGGYLISGHCYYRDPDPPHTMWAHPYFIKADSLGNFLWELAIQTESADYGGGANYTCISPDSQYYYSWIDHYYHVEPYGDCPAFLVLDNEGNLLKIRDLTPTGDYGRLFSAQFINETTIAGSAVWGDESGFPMAIKFDTAGNMLDETLLLENEYMAYVRRSFDGKLLFYTQDIVNDQFDAYLFKLNQDLINDTLYLNPINYDYLCPGYISTDTINVDDCGIIVRTPEVSVNKKVEDEFLIYPNPATRNISIRISEEYYGGLIRFYNTYGQMVKSEIVWQDRPVVDVSSLPSGIFIVIFQVDGHKWLRTKFIKL